MWYWVDKELVMVYEEEKFVEQYVRSVPSHSAQCFIVLDLSVSMMPGLECEEADWIKTSSVKTDLSPEPLVMDEQDLFSLNSFMKSLQ